jgi:hypothetical protein
MISAVGQHQLAEEFAWSAYELALRYLKSFLDEHFHLCLLACGAYKLLLGCST